MLFFVGGLSFEESSVSVEEYSTNRGVAGLGFRGLPWRFLGPIVSTMGLAPEELEPMAMPPADALKQSSSERCIFHARFHAHAAAALVHACVRSNYQRARKKYLNFAIGALLEQKRNSDFVLGAL